MASRLSCCWIYLWIITLLRGVSADPASTPRYILNRTNVTFDQAINNCSPGVLTTLATKQEVADILQLVSSKSLLEQKRFTYWVGLKKTKDECIISTLPLRGFKWMADGGEKMEISHWEEEPEVTCTSVRCAALTGEFNGSTVSSWGLISVTCKTMNQFICKLTDGQTAWRPEDRETGVKPATPKSEPATPEPAAPDSEPATPESNPAAPDSEPAAPESKPAAPDSEPAAPDSEPAAPDSEPAAPESKPAAPDSEPAAPDSEPAAPDSEPAAPESKPESGPESDSCIHPISTSVRSLILDPDNSSRIQVECWSSVQLELHCSGYPAVWRLQDDSPANFTSVCMLCSDGFRKDASGNCVDIDECSSGGGGGSGGGSGPCRHTCLNTEGSYKCVCSDQDGENHDEGSEVCTETQADTDGGSLSGLLIWVLVAVAALIVLMVVVAVTVKCCLMRRSKKRAMKKAEKMAMDSKDGKDSFETANEKTTT